MSFCSQPFNRIEIYPNGDVFNCCPSFIKYYSIGNIFQTPFAEIWNGEKARELRKMILNSDFSLCEDMCNKKNGDDKRCPEFKEYVDKYPEEISVSTDNVCNVRCKICRDERYKTNFDNNVLLDEIKHVWLPIFKDAKVLRFGCSGEPFASYRETTIIKETAKFYPDLKFHFHTNGILGTEEKLKELNVYDKIDTMTVSLHSASRWTYNKIVRGGNYSKVMKNLELYSKMKKEGLIKHLRMIFVVYSENYKEMIKFIEMAEKFGAIAEFWALRNTELDKNFKKFSIINPDHKEHKKLIKLLENPLFNSDRVKLYPEIKELSKNITKTRGFCTKPFENLEVECNGDVFTCCKNWNNGYSIGNIYKDDIEQIWNSKEVIELRKRVMKNDYSLCNSKTCSYLKQKNFPSEYYVDCKPEMKEYPLTLKFIYDYECNIACNICRDKVKRLPDNELEVLNSKIDTVFLPLLKSAKKLIINAHGDPFGSRHSRLVIKKAIEKYPDLKFEFHTNGILCDENNFNSLNITPNKIAKIIISIHAATAETYGKIVPNGVVLFPKIVENLKYLQKLRESNDFRVYIHFVITSVNYKEIPDFIELAEKVGAIPEFWEYWSENCNYEHSENWAIHEKEHPLHNELLEILKNPKVKQYKQNFSPVFYDLIQ